MITLESLLLLSLQTYNTVKSLKAVLLHNGNEFPSIPVGHSVHMKEEYENVKTLLNRIKYTSHNWELWGF